ncbi:hypothetical protein TNCV_3105261 [Trichonephila clavipes]|nr:hypothetical protein TNCV_3105261 [Trichonephila clavipes]
MNASVVGEKLILMEEDPRPNRAKPADELLEGGRGSLVVKVSDRGLLVSSSSPVPLKSRRVGKRCTLNLSRAQTSFCWCGS